MCVSGCCSARQVTTVCRSPDLQTTAAPPSAILTTATITASARTTRANFLFAGKNPADVPTRGVFMFHLGTAFVTIGRVCALAAS